MSAIFGVWHRDTSAPRLESGQGEVQVAFDGRLDNRAGLLDVLTPRYGASARSSDADLVGLMYAHRGEAFVKHLQGDFALAVHDARARRLVLARDAIGVRPLYYAVTPRRIIFASRIQRILDDQETHARPNERLLAALMLQQLHRQDDDGSTFFEGISSIPASHVVVCGVDRVHVTQYWEFEAGGAARSMSFDDCAAALRSHLTVAVERRLRSTSPVAISVSGGLDSAAIFCLARRTTAAAATPMALTYTARDGSPADEHVFVEELERLHGCIEYVDTPSIGSVLDNAPETVRRAEGPMLDVQGNRSTAFMSAVAGRGARVLMTGHWGDQVMFDQAYLVDALRECSWPTVRAHLDEYLRWFPDARGNEFTQRLLSDALDHAAPGWARPLGRRVRRIWRRPQWWQRMYTRRFRAAAGREGFRRQPAGRGETTALCRALYREARSKYHALCLENSQKQSAPHGLAVTFPFLDRDLLAFVLGVPGPILARAGVPKALLREAMRGIVPEPIRTRRTKGDFTAIVAQAAQREFPRMLRILAGEPLVVQFGYVEVDTLIAGLRLAERELAQSESCVAAWRLADIVALELWLQEFFSGQRLEDVVDAPTTRQEQEPDRTRGARR